MSSNKLTKTGTAATGFKRLKDLMEGTNHHLVLHEPGADAERRMAARDKAIDEGGEIPSFRDSLPSHLRAVHDRKHLRARSENIKLMQEVFDQPAKEQIAHRLAASTVLEALPEDRTRRVPDPDNAIYIDMPVDEVDVASITGKPSLQSALNEHIEPIGELTSENLVGAMEKVGNALKGRFIYDNVAKIILHAGDENTMHDTIIIKLTCGRCIVVRAEWGTAHVGEAKDLKR